MNPDSLKHWHIEDMRQSALKAVAVVDDDLVCARRYSGLPLYFFDAGGSYDILKGVTDKHIIYIQLPDGGATGNPSADNI